MSNYDKGARRERELLKKLDPEGFVGMRAPSSGSGGKKADGEERELPDVLAGDGDVFYAFESKTSGNDVIYIDGEEIDDLEFFSHMFGAQEKIAVRFDRMEWFFFDPSELYQTRGGNYRIKKENVNKGETLSELVC